MLYYYYNIRICLQKCVKDTLSPVTIKLQFFQPDKMMADAVLNEDNNMETFIEVRVHNEYTDIYGYVWGFFF